MLQDSQAAAQFIDRLIDAKLAGTEIEPDVRENLHKNLRDRLEGHIVRAIISLLTEQEQRELEHLVDTKQTHKIEEYLTKHGVNINRVLAGAMAEFQASYLGA